ncbi:hypothetical protein ERO13_A01G209050v2 [Gossypium hirsutum]|uniref:GRF-type domain-containing protein n=1 Tax=Gossypium tomentosum TaxID=34277 RepID=A0A5D2RUL1_GOSTO|nr:hypothetical protein ERO13_A01G209050v2 [Gossypium hirsutum]TYI44557.1 hypothetical protein ES332_A01G246400v1 [Gossypium tomentosum]
MEIPTVIPMCYCGNIANLRTSWSNDNPGRRFFGCKKYVIGYQNACHFFTWFDPPVTRSRIVVLGVLKKVRTMEDARRNERKIWLMVLLFVILLWLVK